MADLKDALDEDDEEVDVSYKHEMTDVKDALNVNHVDDSPEQEMRYAITYVSNEQNVARKMDMQENHSLQCDAGMFSTSNFSGRVCVLSRRASRVLVDLQVPCIRAC